MKINRFFFVFLTFFLYSCTTTIEKKVSYDNSFNFSCSLFVKYEENNIVGDCYVYGNDDEFYIDAFAFGSLIFRLKQRGEKITVYIHGYENEYSIDDKIFSIDYLKFKSILLNFLHGKEVQVEKNENYELQTGFENNLSYLKIVDVIQKNYFKISVLR